MKQAVMTRPGAIEVRDIRVPETPPGSLLLRIMRIGICGSDIHVYHGRHPYTKYPVTQGHEVSAVVHEVGAGVGGFSVGDRVTIMPQQVCGTCLPCREGRYNICESLKVMGFQTGGAASEYFAVRADACLKFPATMSFEEGAMIEPLAVAVHALGRLGDVSGRRIVVYGGGPIGNLVAQAARGMGARGVLLTDTSDYRLSLAGACGVDFTVNPAREDVAARLREAFGPEGADASLECVGIEATITQAVSCARKGSDIVVVGVYGETPKVDLGLVQDRELRLIGTLMYRREDYLEAIELITTGKVKLGPLMSAHFEFDRFLDAYHYIEANREKSMKVFIDVG